VPNAIPARPYTRAPGSLDYFVASLENPHVANEAAPGVRVDISGWIVDPLCENVSAAWLDIADIGIPLALDRDRRDVARLFATRDRDGRRLGFETALELPASIPPGTYDARVIGRTNAGIGVYGDTAQHVTIAVPRCPPLAQSPAAAVIPFDLRIRDTQKAPPTFGRGAYTIRQESSLRVSGYVADAERLHIAARSTLGEVVAWEIACRADGGFDAVLWTGDLERGLYDLCLGRIGTTGVTTVAHCGFEIAGPHYLPPMHLTTMQTAPIAALLTFADVGPAAAGAAEVRPVAGRPIGVAGWCLDPASHTPPLAIYAAIDERRPIPLSHHLLDPRPGVDPHAIRCGFGGTIDTTRLEPGRHHVRMLAAAVSGAGWYIIDERTIDLRDHRVATREAGETP
jgi:hypothetical protein